MLSALAAVTTGLMLIATPASSMASPVNGKRGVDGTNGVDATPAAKAQKAALGAKAKVDALLERYQDASAQVDVAVKALSAAFAASVGTEVNQEQSAARERRAKALQAEQVRAVYMAGGPAGLTASILGATSPDDALWRSSTAYRVLANLFVDTREQVTKQAELTRLARNRAMTADAATAAQAKALEALQDRAGVAALALSQAQQTLAALDSRARQAKAALASARQIAAAQKRAAAARLTAMGSVTAIDIPTAYQQAYQVAARTCPGLSWTLLAAVGQVESGHGRNNGPSSAGAIGPMQFRAATFATYAVDGDQDGVRDAWDPDDAIFTAAHYLCASGADGGSATGVHAALLAYNHAEWYVDLVLAAEQAIIARQLALNG